MKQEDNELLLKDLCARLPYGVKCKYYDVYENCYEEGTVLGVERKEYIEIDGRCVNVEEVKPYLFPLSSMTEEQKKDIFRNGTFFFDRHNTLCRLPKHNDDYDYVTFEDYLEITEKLNKNHLDYRGLIPKGLAIDATDKNIY